MDLSLVIMWVGFLMAAYSVVGNDVIQTLGTFLSSNEKQKWYVLWAYAGLILSVVLINGWLNNDIAYGRLSKIDIPTTLEWWYLLPPMVLLIITRFGIPVSTTFLILTLFSMNDIEGDVGAILTSVFDTKAVLGKMIMKSLLGYVVAFGAAIAIYMMTTNILEKRFLENPIKEKNRNYWVVAQWCSTGFLWWQWLTQDLANIYIYLLGGGNLSAGAFALSLIAILGLLGYIFYSKGGAVQKIVKAKTNTTDIRSATFVDLIYGIVLMIFKDWSKIPMSTTWVFIGLLAGREIAIRFQLERKLSRAIASDIGRDLFKVFTGLVVSVVLVVIIKVIGG
ncbi:MAG: hypothetical protein R3E32_15945 [Chitinophagales bacterium]